MAKGRWRRGVGWGFLALAAAGVAVVVATGWWSLSCRTIRTRRGVAESWDLLLVNGTGYMTRSVLKDEKFQEAPRTWGSAVRPSQERTWFFVLPGLSGWDVSIVRLVLARASPSDREVFFILWPYPAAAAVVGGALLASGVRARRRFRAGACTGCGYDLSATDPSAKCPECGRSKHG